MLRKGWVSVFPPATDQSNQRLNGWRSAGLCDLFHMPHVGTAASSQNTHMRKLATDVSQQVSKLCWISVVELLRFVEFGVTTPRRICDDALQALYPRPICEGLRNMVRMGAVDHEVCDIAFRCTVYCGNSRFECASRRQSPIGLNREGDNDPCHFPSQSPIMIMPRHRLLKLCMMLLIMEMIKA